VIMTCKSKLPTCRPLIRLGQPVDSMRVVSRRPRGHVEARRAGFRMVSRRWHKFLGFRDPTIAKKRMLQDMTNPVSPKRARTGADSRGGVNFDVDTDYLWEY